MVELLKENFNDGRNERKNKIKGRIVWKKPLKMLTGRNDKKAVFPMVEMIGKFVNGRNV